MGFGVKGTRGSTRCSRKASASQLAAGILWGPALRAHVVTLAKSHISTAGGCAFVMPLSKKNPGSGVATSTKKSGNGVATPPGSRHASGPGAAWPLPADISRASLGHPSATLWTPLGHLSDVPRASLQLPPGIFPNFPSFFASFPQFPSEVPPGFSRIFPQSPPRGIS